MAAYDPHEVPDDTPPSFYDSAEGHWVPLFEHDCTFGPEIFNSIMLNLIKNPNINTSWLFRADIIFDDDLTSPVGIPPPLENPSQNGDATIRGVRDVQEFELQRTLIRTLVPRNTRRDPPLDQTCTFHWTNPSDDSHSERSLVVYRPHASSSTDVPFYHPKVQGIAHLHQWDPITEKGTISVHFLPFHDVSLQDTKLRRTAYHLLEVLHKHGESSVTGYAKRVHHDVIVPQKACQDRYAKLKDKYARRLVETWAENTDPRKHVFEDLAIAAFLLELWSDMYEALPFPGFVDIGCGNGLLVYILQREGYSGWGFDARERKSWAQYRSSSGSLTHSGFSLEKRLLLPKAVVSSDTTYHTSADFDPNDVHHGTFPRGTFIISNHADELTPWTPILASMSCSPFIMVPCCSHSLTGEKYRAPPPRDKTKPASTYASLVDWTTQIAEDCAWKVETEMLRIPSSRNTCLLGRTRTRSEYDVDIGAVVRKYGGVEGYAANVAKLLKKPPSGH